MPAGIRAAVASLLAVAVLTLATACGGGGDGDGTEKYDTAINAFCTDVKQAADKVQADATARASENTTDPTAAAKALGATFGTFADATGKALADLKGTKVPEPYKDFHDRTVTAYTEVVAKLRAVAKATRSGSLSALTGLGDQLNAVKLPGLPADIRENAKACAAIT